MEAKEVVVRQSKKGVPLSGVGDVGGIDTIRVPVVGDERRMSSALNGKIFIVNK